MLRLFFCLLFGCLSLPSWAQDSVTLQLRWSHQAQFAGYYMAKAKGFYQAQGLDVTLRPNQAGTLPLQQVLEGQAEFAVGNSEVLIGFSQGLPVRAMAAIFQQSPAVLLTPANSPVHSVQNMREKRIRLSPGTADAELIHLLAKHNIRLHELQHIPATGHDTDLHRQDVDVFNGYITNEPFYFAQQGVDVRIFNPADHGIHYYSDVLFTHSEFADKHPVLVERFLSASLQGWAYALAHPDETVEHILTHYDTGKSRAHLYHELQYAVALIKADTVTIGHMSLTRWQHIADSLAEIGLIPPIEMTSRFFFTPPQGIMWADILPWAVIGLGGLLTSSALCLYFYRANRLLQQTVISSQEATAHAERGIRIDPLTGIANRYALLERIQHVIEKKRITQSQPALLFIDLNRFKSVNDTFGHDAGDQVLQHFCHRISGSVLAYDGFFARLAGDEFVVLLKTACQSTSQQLADAITEQAAQPFHIGNQVIHIGASVGITFYHDGDCPQRFLSRADKAMYRHKKARQ
ncbi:ABC transporter substrate-binding protein [Photobacterium aphoticum]|uniref:Thiamine pyrimidine synthase n=1 Tax=Photobacterium aphoticum TaxID=754436 RepID=A0A0J1JKG4_9GAMM|nr:GGDEF domain-containing protein [Photobacterium aphoticum]KLV02582.1 hypothetical protein ABT58_02775 [Photobacterium aphoticum]PSU55063.1 GGDEF domain-containing protein [Photobacterium aphoticum]GHA47150.1 diguanylate cyclase [Photobacterium aphoticum]